MQAPRPASVSCAAALLPQPVPTQQRSVVPPDSQRAPLTLVRLPQVSILLSPPAVVHGPGDAAAVADYSKPRARDAPYTPTTLVGARLPHVAVAVRQPGRLLAQAGSQRVASTVDLAAAAGTSLLLLLSEGGSVGAWEQAAASAEAATGVPLLPVLVAQSSLPAGGAAGAAAGTTVVQDTTGGWLRLRDVPAEGALLVRPDGHICWRHAGGPIDAKLESAVRAVMDICCDACGCGGDRKLCLRR